MFSTLLSTALVEARKLRSGDFSRLRDRFSSLTRHEAPAVMLVRHLQVVRQLTNGPVAALAQRDPQLTRKYVAPYVAQSLNHVERRRILLFHNQYLARHLNRRFFREVAAPERPIWSAHDAADHGIWLKMNDVLGGEGDLTLVFETDCVPLYELSFSLAAKVEGSPAAAMLIVRIQGARGRQAEIRKATADCNDIAPSHLLVCAAQGVAAALGVSIILGVGNREQLSKASIDKAGFLFDYDAFWERLGGHRRRGWFQFDAPFAFKPMTQSSSAHRRRTRRKRQAKMLVSDRVRTEFAARYARA